MRAPHFRRPRTMKKPKLDALTSCRFFAAALIVLHHAAPYFGYPGPDRVLDLSQGVSFFFVLSGFILAYNYVQPGRAIDLGSFYLHRFARIWPAHIAAAALFAYADHIQIDALMAARDQCVANVLLLHAWVPVQPYFFSLNPVSWSISAEFFFYLLFPFMFDRGARPWRGIALACGFLAAILVIARVMAPPTSSDTGLSLTSLIYINPAARLLEFAVGCAACYVFKNWKRAPQGTIFEVVAVALAILSLWVPHLRWDWVVRHIDGGIGTYIWYSGGMPAFALLIMVLAKQAGLLSKALSVRPLVFLGDISFCLYLTHYAVLIWFTWNQDYFPKGASSFAAYLVAIIPIAAAMHFLVEKPCRWLIVRCFERKRQPISSERTEVIEHQQ
jgi:peptidoglycan/LPS O-acetylase OafA/YrhL